MSETTPARPASFYLSNRRRNTGVVILFAFMLLHQADKMVISSLTTPIMDAFGIREDQMGAVLTGAIIVGTLFYPLWGYLYDRYARPRILALASFIWGATTWLGSIAPSFGSFVAARASTGVDDASYPGIYSLIADYFPPSRRGRVTGVLQLSIILGPLVGMGLATALRDGIGWRAVFYITGVLGIVMALVIFLGLKDVPRGRSEPELAGLPQFQAARFSWQAVRALLRKRAFVLLFIEQAIYVFPFNALGFWYYRYLEVERALSPERVMLVISIFGLVSALGHPLAGILGDLAFKRTPRGRMLVSAGGVTLLVTFFSIALSLPKEQFGLFVILQTIGALFTGFAFPNTISTLQDIVEPEVRSTAHAVLGIADTGGSALAPYLTGLLAVGSSLQNAMRIVVAAGWGGGLIMILLIVWLLPRDVLALREKMKARAAQQKSQ